MDANFGLVFVENKFAPVSQARLPVLDLAIQRGFGFFETLRTYNRKPFTLPQRLERILDSAKSSGFKSLPREEKIASIVRQGIGRIKHGEVLVKIILTGGDGDGVVAQNPCRLIVFFLPFHPFPAWQYQKGVKVRTVGVMRPLPELKSTSYLPSSWAAQKALDQGFDEAVFKNHKQELLEGTNFNIALIKGRQVISPQKDVLNGFTMRTVLKLAQKRGFVIRRLAIAYRELSQADEVFITSTNREVIPVAQIDKIKIGSSGPGKWSRLLLEDYRRLVFQNANKKNKNQKIS